MGRKTYESIGKPLPNRTNIVISRNEHFALNNSCIITHSVEEAIAEGKKHSDEVIAIGGEEVYKKKKLRIE